MLILRILTDTCGEAGLVSVILSNALTALFYCLDLEREASLNLQLLREQVG